MANAYVSDLFGYNITNDSPIIVINTDNINEFITKIAKNQSDGTSVWRYNKSKIDDILESRNVDPNNFVVLGDLFYKKGLSYKSLILGNKNICYLPTAYEEIISYSNGKIVRPFYISGNDKIYTVGLFYIEKPNDLDVTEIGIIPNDFTVKIKRNMGQTNQLKSSLDVNEFGLLSSTELGITTISKNSLLKNKSRKFHLQYDEGKYLTVIDNDVKIKQKLPNLAQAFSYNAQGELTNDGKCLTYKDNSSTNSVDSSSSVFTVSAEECDPVNDKQKWLMHRNHISPSNNFGTCLGVNPSDNETILLSECKNNVYQNWSTEHEGSSDGSLSDSDNSSDYSWDMYHGKTVVLVENSNPWFINSDTVSKASYINVNDEQTLYSDIGYRSNANYESKFILNPNSPSLGYGHSFASRGGVGCNKIEGFGNVTNNNLNDSDCNIMVIIIMLAILLIIYKVWKFGTLF